MDRGRMKIVSLLPSATEICFALGVEDRLEAVTFECDYPAAAGAKPHVTTSAIPQTDDPAEIDRLVRASMDAGSPIYSFDEELIRSIDPDLVLAQDLCRVCAVPSGHIQEALDRIGHRAEVLSLDPSSVEEVIACVETVAAVAGVKERGQSVAAGLRRRIETVRGATEALPAPRVLTLEWSDPAFVGGHWVPEMVSIAGGTDVFGMPGERSRTVEWAEIGAAPIDVAVFMPCGYDLQAAVAEGGKVMARPELRHVSQLFAVDATAYFSRPGPRIVDGIEMLAWALHPEAFPEVPPGRIARLR